MTKPSDPVAAEMGRRIKAEREAKGLSQKELADLAGCTPAAVGNWEQGTRRVRWDNAQELAKVFKLPAGYFLIELSRQEAMMLLALRENKT